MLSTVHEQPSNDRSNSAQKTTTSNDPSKQQRPSKKRTLKGATRAMMYINRMKKSTSNKQTTFATGKPEEMKSSLPDTSHTSVGWSSERRSNSYQTQKSGSRKAVARSVLYSQRIRQPQQQQQQQQPPQQQQQPCCQECRPLGRFVVPDGGDCRQHSRVQVQR